MKLIADSGSTKTDWSLVDGGNEVMRFCGQGINPFQQDAGTIREILSNEVVARVGEPAKVGEICFYGAGCREEMKPMMRDVFGAAFTQASVIDVQSDLLAAARALFGMREGIACIIGTGSNSCYYNGREVADQVSPLGYILGDEGSGAVLGKLFVNAIFKGVLSDFVREAFLSCTGLTLAGIIERVYRKPLANRFLAGLSPYIHELVYDEGVRTLVVDNFRAFFRRNVALYKRDYLKAGVVGGMAFHYREQLEEAAALEGVKLGPVLRSPIEGLVNYHSR